MGTELTAAQKIEANMNADVAGRRESTLFDFYYRHAGR
jgi:hypothetical protein